MDLAIVGLGRMGGNMARRLHNAGHRVVAFNRSPDKTREIMGEGLEGGFTPQDVVNMLTAPRIVWLMVPAGDATEQTMDEFAGLCNQATRSSTAATPTSRTPSAATIS